MSNDYTLPVPEGAPKRLAAGWLTLGLAALLASGVFSILLVLSRTPGVQAVIPWQDFFHTALVVHVDLSVLIWFLAFAGVLWSLNNIPRSAAPDWAALALMTIGTVIMTFAPFFGVADPLMNNYVPVLQHPVFFVSLGFIAVGFALLIARSLTTASPLSRPLGPVDAMRIGLIAGAATAALSLVALLWSYLAIGPELKGQWYYEYLFWGGGHVLQFTHTVLMLLAWLWLGAATGLRLPLTPKLTAVLFVLAAAPAVLAIPIYLAYDIDGAHRLAFTDLMEYGGLTAVPLGAVAAWALVAGGRAAPADRAVRASLICSVGLFAVGGILGFLIRGVNVVIPAHYHGSIVGVTLAFMGLTFVLLPRLGFREVAPRLAHAVPYVYGGGQLLHILGLAWSGGYGVQRKTVGAEQGLENIPQIAGMAMMGLGGLVAIIGGLLFLVVAIKAMWPVSRARG